MPIKPARLATPILTLSLLAGCGGDGLSSESTTSSTSFGVEIADTAFISSINC